MKTPTLAKWVLGTVIVIVAAAAYCKYEYLDKDVIDTQSKLISGSGILSGILIAFLSNKLFQLADERNKARIVLNEYADKLTLFRKILFHVMKSSEFWVYKSHVNMFRKDAPNANWHILHSINKESNEFIKKFWLGETEKTIYTTTVDLYLAMEEIVSTTKDSLWIYNSDLFEYDLEYLLKAEMPSNQIWYYLEGRYAKHTDGQVKEIASTYELSELNSLVRSVAPKYKDSEFSRELLGNMGGYFESEVLPEMIRLTQKITQRFTRSILKMFMALTVVMVFGVIFPLIMAILDLGETEKLITATCVTTTVISLLIFLIDLLSFAINDDEQSITDKERVLVKSSSQD